MAGKVGVNTSGSTQRDWHSSGIKGDTESRLDGSGMDFYTISVSPDGYLHRSEACGVCRVNKNPTTSNLKQPEGCGNRADAVDFKFMTFPTGVHYFQL